MNNVRMAAFSCGFILSPLLSDVPVTRVLNICGASSVGSCIVADW